MGRPSLDLACSIMARAMKSRTRAAACTMLCFLCGDEPDLLAPYLTDSRWYVVRNAVFVLGQIGGSAVVPMLRVAAFHPEPRVRRQVVQSLGNVPRGESLPIMLAQLDTRDPQLLAATLHMLTRHQDEVVARAILKHIEAPDFETRSDDNQRSLFNALVEVANDSAVPALETLLHKGGWFARKTFQRSAAARALQKLGSEASLAALEAGLRSRSEAVRQACLDAMSRRSA
jgi:HEAT repeat protein